MRDLIGVRDFLEGEATFLEEFDFVAVRPAGTPLHRIEIARGENQELGLQLATLNFVKFREATSHDQGRDLQSNKPGGSPHDDHGLYL